MSFMTPPRDGQTLCHPGLFRQRQRNRYSIWSVRNFASGLAQAVARRMGRRPEVVSRMLGAPGNWRLDTVSDLLFAISGAEAAFTTRYPMAESAPDAAAPADAVATPAAPSPAPTARDGRTKG